MKRSFWMMFMMLGAAACSARGSTGGSAGPEDADTPADVKSPDVLTPEDLPAVDVITPEDIASPDVVVPEDIASPDVPAVDVPVAPDSTTPRCTRDSECTGSTWCDAATGACTPIACTPGRVSCVTGSRLRTCNARGSAFSEMDCPGGCAGGVCTGGMTTCMAPMTECGGACVAVQSDPANCGACGVACAAGQTCAAGVCTGGTEVCTPPLRRCGALCVDAQSDPANCGACGRACLAGQTCTAGACAAVGTGPSLRIESLGSTSCAVLEHAAVTGDDRGGIAMGATGLFYSGDTATGRFDLDTLAGVTTGRVYDGLVSNLRAGTVYNLATASGGIVGTATGGTITSLIEIDGATGAPTTRTVPLSTPVVLGSDTGIFSGWDRVVFASGGAVYNVDLPSGRVTNLGAMVFPMHQGCESWAFWGVAEYFDGRVHLSYVESSTRVARVRVPDATVSTVGTFTSLSDMCSFTVSPSRNRWYFHHEGVSQFGGSDESVGRCPAVISSGGAVTCAAPLTMCATGCADLASDAANCGACARACTAGQSCRAGACSTVTTGPSYARTTPPASVAFVDVCAMATATRVLAGLDDQSVLASLPFPFNFWGTALPTGRMINVATNGLISFDGVLNSYVSVIPETAGPNGVIAAWVMDLVASTSPGVCYATLGAAPSRRFVVQWANARPYGSSTTGLISTEIVLNEADGAIDILTSNYTFAASTTALIGVENLDGTRAISGCAATTGMCTNATNNRIRFVPSP